VVFDFEIRLALLPHNLPGQLVLSQAAKSGRALDGHRCEFRIFNLRHELRPQPHTVFYLFAPIVSFAFGQTGKWASVNL
jgi:hypothetical protein